MKIPFWKMHGAGNDFIMIDDRERTFPVSDTAWIAGIARRRFGVGCDGVILVQPADATDFRMVFYNPDGCEVEMCGNGARCVARLANDLGIVGTGMVFDTVAGAIRATVDGDRVTLQMTDPFDWAFDQSIEIGGELLTFHQVNSGVPHVVVEVDDVEQIDLLELGAGIRYNERFPNGTNANFIQITGPDALCVRTYERGVEAETLACGTGMVACGLIAGKLGRVSCPVKITCASGDVLEVGYADADEGAVDVRLKGPAVHVFSGALDYPGGA